MKTVRDACTLQENALEIRVSDQITQLDQVIADEEDGRKFFGRTHVTGGLHTLMNEGLARLSGKSTQSIFHLKQAMGGGKTHLMTGMGLLARHPGLRETVCPDLASRFPFGTATVAAFNGRNRPNEYFWGEIAKQLGKAEMFREFWVNGPEAPDEAAWLRLFDDGVPTLILLDELPPYFDYYVQKEMGGGTVANIMTFGFATLLTAAAKKSNVCVMVADLAASYEGGGRVINKALDDARQELGRQEKTITPVDLAGNEIYDILRKNLFKKLPDPTVIENIAEAYGRALTEASKSKTVTRSAESIADEIALTYPFHPRLKNLIALFKENEKFRQTRGLMELVSRLLRSVWDRDSNDVYLLGPQHFDFSIPDVRDAFERIGSLRDVMARDLWDENQSAHAQVIDLNAGNDCATQVGSIILTASLSTAVNAVKGLSKTEILECVITPLTDATQFATGLDALHGVSWHMHTTTDDRYYFDPQENLGRILQSYAEDAPDGQIDTLKRDRLADLFKVQSGTVYQRVLPLPALDDIKDEVRRGRVLLIVEPDSKVPPERVSAFFADLTQKNNLCVLTGDRTEMAKLDTAARQIFSVKKAERRIDANHSQYSELQKRKEEAEQAFFSTVQALFDKVLRPVVRGGKEELRPEAIDTTRDQKEPFSGEKQIEKTLASDKVGKLILNVEESYDAVRSKAEALLWPAGEDRARWSDIIDRSAENPSFFWLPPKGLETLKRLATEKGRWEDDGDGWVSKNPKKKKTSAQVTVISEMSDAGKVRLQVTPVHAGPAPQVYVSTKTPVSNSDKKLTELTFDTDELRLFFLVEDPSQQFETGEVKSWETKLKLACSNEEQRDGSRFVELKVLPRGTIRYSLDGSEPRHGLDYIAPIDIGMGEVHMLAFAEIDGLETKSTFTFPKMGGRDGEDGGTPIVDPTKPASITKRLEWGGRAESWKAISAAKANNAVFGAVRATLGDGDRSVTLNFGSDIEVSPDILEAALNAVQAAVDESAPLSVTARKARFNSGHDLTVFANQLGLALKRSEVDQ
jgi:hypothetical protein